jgi:anion-transporting  ArsA/GET3 family ATPase
LNTRVIVCCGSGGVGKTTTSAALALSLAQEGHRVAVLTIDPARRLADSLGIGPLSNEPQRVPLEGMHLDAMMLDMKATWDGVIRRFSPSEETRDRILANRYYQLASTRLAGSHEFMAMQRLYELAESDNYDVVLLDTPPSRHALEFLQAPRRLSGLFDEGVMTWISMPKNSRGLKALQRGSEVVSGILERLLGGSTIREIAQFFDSMQGLWVGFQDRSNAVQELLRGPNTQFLLVTTPAPAARAEAVAFLELLREDGLPFGGFLVNRVTPEPSQPDLGPVPEGVDPVTWQTVQAGLERAYAVWSSVARTERQWLEALRQGTEKTWLIPEQARDVHSLAALRECALHLPPRDFLQ